MRISRIYFAVLILFLAAIALSPAVCAADEQESERIKVGFLDSGISTKHLRAAQTESGENFVFEENDTVDRTGHGTETAGIVLGSADGSIKGICPDAVAVPLVCYDRYPSGVAKRVSAAEAAKAIRAAVDKYSCRILNVSLGFSEDDPDLREAVEYAAEKGVLIVAAVGNDNENNPEKKYYPAAYDSVLGVGCAENGTVASFSQRHGVDIVTDSRFFTVGNKNSESRLLRVGTSYACAYISGLCARLWQENPSLSSDELRALLLRSAQDIGESGFDAASGHGYIPAVFPEEAFPDGFFAESARSPLFLPKSTDGTDLGVYDFLNRNEPDPRPILRKCVLRLELPLSLGTLLPAISA